VVSGDNHDVLTTRCCYAAKESIIEFLRPITGCRGVKHITGHKEDLYLFLFKRLAQPIQEGRKLLITSPAVK
jgi:hypothetical protein